MGLLDGAEFPQHARLAAFGEGMEVLHEFIHDSGYVLCTWNESENAFVPVTKDYEEIIFEFFEIDREELEKEHRIIRDLLINMLARDSAEELVEHLEAMQKEGDER